MSECIVPEVKEKIKHQSSANKRSAEASTRKNKSAWRRDYIRKGSFTYTRTTSINKGSDRKSYTDNEREVWESLNDLIIERAEAIMYRGGIQALELLEADKKTIKTLEKILKEEQAFGDSLEKNNPKTAKRLMTKQLVDEKKRKRKKAVEDKDEIHETVPA